MSAYTVISLPCHYRVQLSLSSIYGRIGGALPVRSQKYLNPRHPRPLLDLTTYLHRISTQQHAEGRNEEARFENEKVGPRNLLDNVISSVT